MSDDRGQAFLLKTFDDKSNYTTAAGLKTKHLAINGDKVATTSRNGNAWRELLAGAGTRSVSITGSGIFIGSAAERQVRNMALAGSVDPYELSFESGERMRGNFLVTKLEYIGDFNGERNYEIAMESSGEVTLP